MAGEMAETIGKNIRAARLAKGWKQRELAREVAKRDTSVADSEDAAISNTTVSEWERGIRKPGDRYMPLVAGALSHEIAWFMKDHGKPQETPDPFVDADTGQRSQLDRIEDSLNELIERLVAAGVLAAVEKDNATTPSATPSKRRKRAA